MPEETRGARANAKPDGRVSKTSHAGIIRFGSEGTLSAPQLACGAPLFHSLEYITIWAEGYLSIAKASQAVGGRYEPLVQAEQGFWLGRPNGAGLWLPARMAQLERLRLLPAT